MTGRDLARQIAESAIVLLKNHHSLPLEPGKTAAFFGRTQIDTIFSGNGSGAAGIKGSKCILDACEAIGLHPVEGLQAWYRAQHAYEQSLPPPGIDWSQAAELVHSGVIYELFGQYHPPKTEPLPPDALILQASQETDKAIMVYGRNAGGEECDRRLENDYLISDAEKQLVEKICAHFTNVVLIVNANGPVDLAWAEEFPAIRSILFAGIPGDEGGTALANILTGRVNPSGKLSTTFAKTYEDYPSARHFSFNKDDLSTLLTYESYGLNAQANGSHGCKGSPVTVYEEGLLMGYRGFDDNDIEPLYPFGYGLSYTQFHMEVLSAEKRSPGLCVKVRVKNIGATTGREVVQLYASPFGTENPQPKQHLTAFGKTCLLESGHEQTLSLFMPWRNLAAYSEEHAAWRIEQGCYVLGVGNSSRHTQPAVRIEAHETLLVEQCSNLLTLAPCNRGKVQIRTPAIRPEVLAPACPIRMTLLASDVANQPACDTSSSPVFPVVQQLSNLELASLCVGYGPGTPFAALRGGVDPETVLDNHGQPLTRNSHPVGWNGYVSPAIPAKGIFSMAYCDGPAGVGGLAWPTAMLMACSFDTELCHAFGDAVAQECEQRRLDVWLAPAVNLHRHPLCGRNFEYYSEDPLLTGACAAAIARGAQENHTVLVCPKHFAANEQETFRRGSLRHQIDAVDSIVDERTLRELYLLPFEMLVRSAGVKCMMTSFNKINGVFAAGNRDLCTRLLRNEWHFDGLVITDWGDMDYCADGADAVAAGNDVVMPGGPPVIAQILAGLEDGRVTRRDLETAVTHLLRVLPKKPYIRLE